LHGADVLPGQGGGWHEYGAYLGPIVIALALLGLVGWRDSRVVRAAGVGVVIVLLLSSLGPYLKSVFDVVPWLPRSYTSRVVILAVFGLALLTGFGLDALKRWSKTSWIGLLRIILIGLVAIDLMSLVYPLSEQAFVLSDKIGVFPPASAPLAFTRETHRARVGPVEFDRAYLVTRAGYGTMSYCSALGPKTAVVSINESNSEYVRFGQGEGSVNLMEWLPNRVVVLVKAKKPSTVVINTNYALGWRADGVAAVSVAGRVGAQVPVGERVVTFRYHPPGFMAGLLVSVCTVVLAILFAFRKSRCSPGR